MLWPDVEERAKAAIKNGAPIADSILKASDSVMSEQLKVISIPKRFSGPMREIWQLQPRLEQWRGGRALKIMENRRFRASYDFLCLRAGIEPKLKPMAKWWTEVQEVDERDRLDFMSKKPMIEGIWGNKVTSATGKKRRRYNNKNRRRKVSKDN
jgi:poly(A) polymerase